MFDSEFRLQAADELQRITTLVRRSAVLWLVVFGLLTMLGIEKAPYYKNFSFWAALIHWTVQGCLAFTSRWQ